jgi:hypothetical protein
MSVARVLVVSAAVCALLSVTISIASAGPVRPDSAAPAGAAADWLPPESWVMERWVPFDESALQRIFGQSTAVLTGELDRTGLTLDDLARQRGVPARTLAARLVASRHLPRRSQLRTTLLRRTKRVLSQSHLSVHLLSHVFHTWTVTRRTQTVFGVSLARFRQLYFVEGLTMQRIAAAGGVSATGLRRRAVHAAEVSGGMGVRNGAMSAAENRVMRARDRRNYESWAAYHVPVRRTATAAAASTRIAYCAL